MKQRCYLAAVPRGLICTMEIADVSEMNLLHILTSSSFLVFEPLDAMPDLSCSLQISESSPARSSSDLHEACIALQDTVRILLSSLTVRENGDLPS